jgi:hypothetical protein
VASGFIFWMSQTEIKVEVSNVSVINVSVSNVSVNNMSVSKLLTADSIAKYDDWTERDSFFVVWEMTKK